MECYSEGGSEVVEAVAGEGRRGAASIPSVINRTNALPRNG
jgi:hypothetical protein